MDKVILVLLAIFAAVPPVWGSGHGPIFGLATPTNGKGGWSLDWSFMGRQGEGETASMSETMLGYGVTDNIQLSFSAPAIFTVAPFPPTRGTGMMPVSSDFEGLVAWRFQKHEPAVGTRIETTAYVGLLVPGLQRPLGLLGQLKNAPGAYTAIATGLVSRVNYFWAGIGNTHYAENDGDERPNIFDYTLVYGYRPPFGRKEYPHLDWRLFAEMTGEGSSLVRRAGLAIPGTGAHQVFLGPSMLGIYKNYGIEGGIQFPVFRDVGPRYVREDFRVAIDFSYFF
jgi:hypothetical protein